ncbi:MAG: hypothetical protein NW207_05815 [Cytophagales bacterium]|nr:hypothetical protein [Cytophagales bacterium]
MEKIDYEPDFIDGKYLGIISQDFIKVADYLKESSYQIRKRNFSEMPIFAVGKSELAIGTLLYGKYEFENEWNYYASFAEEFLQRNLISEEKITDFKQTYKNPDEYCCLFVVDEQFVNFVFIPYPDDSSAPE